MTTTIEAGERISITLDEGAIFVVKTAANSTGVICKHADASATTVTRTWNLGPNQTQIVGPYDASVALLLSCSAGSLSAERNNGLLVAPVFARNENGSITGLLGPDGEWLPLGETGAQSATASVALSALELVYVKPDGTLGKADATAEGREAVGFTIEAVASGASAAYCTAGSIMIGLSGLTPGATYYMSRTAGALADAAAVGAYGAGNVVLPVGKALSASKLVFSPGTPVTL